MKIQIGLVAAVSFFIGTVEPNATWAEAPPAGLSETKKAVACEASKSWAENLKSLTTQPSDTQAILGSWHGESQPDAKSWEGGYVSNWSFSLKDSVAGEIKYDVEWSSCPKCPGSTSPGSSTETGKMMGLYLVNNYSPKYHPYIFWVETASTGTQVLRGVWIARKSQKCYEQFGIRQE